MIVHAQSPVTLVGGGHLGTDDLAIALSLAPVMVAADGGAIAALAAGHDPVAVLGDMDSLPLDLQARLGDRLHRMPEQETTDFDKALRSIAAPVVIAVGFTGGRMDHALAVLHSLVAHPDRPCIVVGSDDVTFLCPRQINLNLAPDDPLSLFPLRPGAVTSTGLVWPTDGLKFAVGNRIGTSNRVTGGLVTLQSDHPGHLVILPRARLAGAVQAVLAADHWPAVRATTRSR
jgi:thiamine pyrophosphokinase